MCSVPSNLVLDSLKILQKVYLHLGCNCIGLFLSKSTNYQEDSFLFLRKSKFSFLRFFCLIFFQCLLLSIFFAMVVLPSAMPPSYCLITVFWLASYMKIVVVQSFVVGIVLTYCTILLKHIRALFSLFLDRAVIKIPLVLPFLSASCGFFNSSLALLILACSTIILVFSELQYSITCYSYVIQCVTIIVFLSLLKYLFLLIELHKTRVRGC